jgi:glycosyltransferase involved in cell wall biosynthesis
MHNTTIAVLVPAWNEAKRIREVVRPLRDVYPVIVVDDGSDDGTAAAAEAEGAVVLRHADNMGKGRALLTGFAWILEQEFEAVITLDADGQHDPSEIHKFMAAFRQGAGDLIIGRRRFSRMPFPRSTANRIGSWVLSRVLGQPIHDNQSGYRLYSRTLLEKFDLKRAGFELEVEAIVQAVSLGVRIGWVDIETIYGIDKVSYFHPLRDSYKFLELIWNVARRKRELGL